MISSEVDKIYEICARLNGSLSLVFEHPNCQLSAQPPHCWQAESEPLDATR